MSRPSRYARWLLLACLILLLALAGCRDEPSATAAAVAAATATPAPTDTPPPTETAVPTATATPTDTPAPTDTPTPTATATPTATETPTPSQTPTNTPLPPAPTAPPATATASFITVYYVSNPNDILGVFPVRPFDANAMYNNMIRMRNSLHSMRDSLNGTLAGDAAACASYTNAYRAILNAGVFYDDVPGDWQDIDVAYFLSFVFSLDRTRPAYLSCVDAGQVDQFNYGLASVTIDQTLQVLNPAISSAAAKLGTTP